MLPNPTMYSSSSMGSFAQQIKSQLSTVLMLKSSTDKDANVMMIIFGFLMMFMIEEFFRVIPMVFSEIKQGIIRLCKSKTNQLQSLTTLSKVNKSSITFEKLFAENVVTVTDAIMDRMVKVSEAQHIIFTCGRFLVNHYDWFQLETNINVRMKEIFRGGEKNAIEKIIIEVSSTEYHLTELQSRVESIHSDFLLQLQNKLGTTIYYFNEVVIPLMINVDGTLNYSGAKSNISFTKRPFVTTRTLSNMFGKEVDLIRKRLSFFMNNKDWYVSKGIPYTFGLLLHGDPGCGKTSVIKAISNMTGRHIVNIGFHENLTKTQLEHLFLDPTLYVTNAGNNEQYNIPIHKRIYVIEDIDCGDNNVIMKREQASSTNDNGNNVNKFENNNNSMSMTNEAVYDSRKMEIQKKMAVQTQTEKLNLSFLLNLLDGVLETPGRILIMTSNFPEKIDSAFIRPGRVDLSLHFKKCEQTTVMDMYEDYYSTSDSSLKELQDRVFSPAEVNQILFSNFENPHGASTELLKKQEVVMIKNNLDKQKEHIMMTNCSTPIDML